MGFWQPLFFWIFAIGALVSSVAVLAFRNPLYSALCLIADFFCFAGLYVLLSAHFMAVTQVLVYGGAIMVLFVFIIMLLNLSEEELGSRRFSLHQIIAFGVGFGVLAFAAISIWSIVDEEKVAQQREQAVTAYEKAREKHEKEVAEAKKAQKERDEKDDDGEDAPDDQIDEEFEKPFIVETKSQVPGPYADLSEDALIQRYRARVDSWHDGETTYAEGRYDRFNPDEEMVVPPAMVPDESSEDLPGKGAIEPRLSQERGPGGIFGTVEPISILLVNRFVVPFELTAILLLAAIIGAVIIAKKRLD